MSGVSRGKLSVLLILLAGSFFAWNIVKDLGLEKNVTVTKEENLPEVTVEDLEFSREISGDKWLITVGEAIKAGVTYSLADIRMNGAMDNGNIWTVDSPEGIYNETDDLWLLKQPQGFFRGEKEPVHWIAPEANISTSRGQISFESGIRIEQNLLVIDGRSGYATFDGLFILSEGADALWSIE